MAENAIQGLGDVDILVTEINTELKDRPIAPSTVASQVAWVRGATEGVRSIGKKTIFPQPLFGNRAKVRSIYEEVPATIPEVAKFSVEHQEWAPDALAIPRYTQLTDLYGIVQDNSQPILAQAMTEMEVQLAQLIGTGDSTTVDYDGKFFFAASGAKHECNPNRPGLATFQNYYTSFDLNYDNLTAALDYLDAIPGPDGNPLNMPGRNIVIVSTGVQERNALTYLNGEFVPNSAGTATQSNAGLKGRADVVKLVPLRAYHSAKMWCVCRIADAKHRPFMFSKVLPPTMYLEGVSIDEHSQVLRSVARQGWRSVHGFGYLYPHLAIGCVES